MIVSCPECKNSKMSSKSGACCPTCSYKVKDKARQVALIIMLMAFLLFFIALAY